MILIYESPSPTYLDDDEEKEQTSTFHQNTSTTPQLIRYYRK